MRTRTATAFAAGLLAALVSLAACGGGNDGEEQAATTSAGDDAAASILASAAETATDAGSSRVTFTITTQVPEQEAPVTLRGEGEFDYANQVGQMTYDFGELFAASGVEGADEPAEVIVDGTTFYMRFPLLSGLIPGGKPWLKFDLQALGAEQGLDLGQLQQLNQGDPSQILGYLRGAGTVEEVGTETVGGVETTHYEAVVELDRVADQAPPELQEQMRQQIELLKEQSGTTELPMEVWVDAEGLPRRVMYTFDLSLGDPESKTSTVIVMDFSDYGLDVTVEPPREAEVTDITDLAAAAGATTAG